MSVTATGRIARKTYRRNIEILLPVSSHAVLKWSGVSEQLNDMTKREIHKLVYTHYKNVQEPINVLRHDMQEIYAGIGLMGELERMGAGDKDLYGEPAKPMFLIKVTVEFEASGENRN